MATIFHIRLQLNVKALTIVLVLTQTKVIAGAIGEKQQLTLKATGKVLLHLQCDGNTEQRKFGLSVRTSSAG